MAFYTLLTNIGIAKLANATALGTTVQLTHIAVGDGNGIAITPVQTATVLTHEVWRAALNGINVDPDNSNWIVAEGYIPSTSGGFTVREVGLFDVDGDLIAIGSYPDTYKPTLASGSAKDLYIKVIIEVSNASVVTLKINPAVVLATREYVDLKTLPKNATFTEYSHAISGLAAINVQTAIDETVAMIGTATIDIDTRQNAHIPLSNMAAYHLLSGALTLSNTVTDTGFATTLYTGNGATQSVVTGIDMTTQWGNLATEKFGGLVWVKSRSFIGNNVIGDTLQGPTNHLWANLTNTQTTNTGFFTSFNNNGFSIGVGTDLNQNAGTLTSWNFQTTHRITGITNHGKPYECHYNLVTGFTMVKYTGSGIAGHEIPHHLGRKLSSSVIKNLSSTNSWQFNADGTVSDSNFLYFDLTNGIQTDVTASVSYNDTAVKVTTQGRTNTDANNYILYGWANSYYDAQNTLVGNYEVGIYQGTGVSGNKVTTKGKPAWVMIKRLDSAENWRIFDNLRNTFNNELYPNLSNAEGDVTVSAITANSDSFIHKGIAAGLNASGGQYLYMVVYDNDSSSGKSKYPRATDTSNLNLNAIVPFANGVDAMGAKNSILTKNETVSGLTLTEGKNYVYAKNDGTYGVTKYAPTFLKLPKREVAGETPNFFKAEENKWYPTLADGVELISNGTFDSNIVGWADNGLANLSWVSGRLRVTNSSTGYGQARTTIATVIDMKYKVRMKASPITSTITTLNIGTTAGGTEVYAISGTDIIVEFVAKSTTTHISLQANNNGASTYCDFDFISVFNSTLTLSSTSLAQPINYLNAIVYADAGGQPTYVEQLPKTKYEDIIKANEYQGKNACTAWGGIDASTTPPTPTSSFNIKAIVRIATGINRCYFKVPMDNTTYIVTVESLPITFVGVASKSLYYVDIYTTNSGATYGNYSTGFQIFGGKN